MTTKPQEEQLSLVGDEPDEVPPKRTLYISGNSNPDVDQQTWTELKDVGLENVEFTVAAVSGKLAEVIQDNPKVRVIVNPNAIAYLYEKHE